MKKFLILAAFLFASPALAQNPGVVTTGSATNGHSVVFIDRFHIKDGGAAPSGVSSVFGRTGAVAAQSGDYSVGQVTGAAPLNSPTFTGTPAAPTPSTADNSTKLATTAWVNNQDYAPSASPIFSGTITLPDGRTWTSSGLSTLAVGDGTTTVPAVGFINETNTGFYRSGNNSIGIIIGGTDKYHFSGGSFFSNQSGGWYFPTNAASSTVPTLVPNGTATTTGIGAQASGNVSVIVGGVEKTRFTSNGAIFIGNITAATLDTAGIVAGSLCQTSAGLFEYEAGVNCFAAGSGTVTNVATGGGLGGGPITISGTLYSTVNGDFLNLLGNSAGSVQTASWTADQLTAFTTLGGQIYNGSSLSLSFNGATTGAGAMDTGSMPNGAALSIYAIFNPSGPTWSTLGTITGFGAVYSGSHMPSGYTASRLIWAGITASTNMPAFQQYKNIVNIADYSVSTTLSNTACTSLSVSAHVPPAARWVGGNFGVNPSAVQLDELFLASDSTCFGRVTSGSQAAAAIAVYGNFLLPIPVNSQALYYQTASASNTAGFVIVTKYGF